MCSDSHQANSSMLHFVLWTDRQFTDDLLGIKSLMGFSCSLGFWVVFVPLFGFSGIELQLFIMQLYA